MATYPGKTVLETLTHHWRGTARLLPVIVLNVICVGLVLNLVQEQARGAAEWLVILLACLCCLVVPVWQCVGLVRCSSAHVRETGDNLLPLGGYLVLVAVLFATVSQTVDSILALHRFQAPPSVATTAIVLPVTDDGRTVHIAHEIDYAVLTALREALERAPEIRTVELHSDGGLIYAARAIAGVVLEHGLDSHVTEICASACTLIFAAGNRRTLAGAAKLGFHAYGKRTPNHILMVDALEEQAKDIAFLKERGVSGQFLERIYQADSNEMWFPDRGTLNASGILTQP